MDIKQQTQNVANQGRYGDSMLMHVNPAEVKGLASALPLTVNPQTGQPEAFLPFLAPLLGSALGTSLLTGVGAGGVLGAAGMGSALASGIGAGLATYAQTGGSGSKALLSGLTAGFGTNAANTAAEQAIGSAASDVATTAATTAGTLNPTEIAQLGAQESAKAIAARQAANPLGTGTFDALKDTFMTGPDGSFAFDQGAKALASGAGSPSGMAAGIAAGTAGVQASQEAFARQIGESEEAYRRRREAMYRDNPEPILFSAEGGRTGYFMGGDMRAAIDSVDGQNITGGELPQIFAPARQAYDVNPNFMPGFNPETMYFNPATIAAPASSLTANSAPPVVEDTYTGTKGGYGGDPLVISPQGQQASIDPFSAYTGEAPAGLVPYSTTLPSLDITGTDLGLPMGEGTPAPAGVVFDDEIVTLDEQEGENNFTDPNVIDPNNIGGGVYIPNIGNINIPAIMSGMGNFDIPESFVPMGGQDFGITQPIIDYQLANTFDLIPEEEIPVVTRKGGGDTLKPIPEGNKGLPNLPVGVRKEMGYMQAGGMTDMQNDPLTQEVTAFLLGESNNEEALNMFLTKYGNEAFMQLREAVLQSIVPGAQTEGLIQGNGQGGMDDDLRGMIGDKERIAVSQDEFIIPADVVSMLGDGSSDAGSKELYDMMDRVRQEKTGTTKQAPRLANAGGMLPA